MLGQIILNTLDIILQMLKLFILGEIARAECLSRRPPLADIGTVAGKPSLEADTMFHSATCGGRATAAVHTSARHDCGRSSSPCRRTAIDNVVTPAIFDIANTTNQWLFGHAGSPKVSGADEFLDNIVGSDLEQV